MHEGDDIFARTKTVDMSKCASSFSKNTNVTESSSSSESYVNSRMTKSTTTRTTSFFLIFIIIAIIIIFTTATILKMIDEVVIITDDDDDFWKSLTLSSVEGHGEVESVGEAIGGLVVADSSCTSSGGLASVNFLVSGASGLEDRIDDGVCASSVWDEDERHLCLRRVHEDFDSVDICVIEDDELAGSVAIGDAHLAFTGEVDGLECCETTVCCFECCLGKVVGEADFCSWDEVVEGTGFEKRIAVVWGATDADEGHLFVCGILDGFDEVDEITLCVCGDQVAGIVEEYAFAVLEHLGNSFVLEVFFKIDSEVDHLFRLCLLKSTSANLEGRLTKSAACRGDDWKETLGNHVSVIFVIQFCMLSWGIFVTHHHWCSVVCDVCIPFFHCSEIAFESCCVGLEVVLGEFFRGGDEVFERSAVVGVGIVVHDHAFDGLLKFLVEVPLGFVKHETWGGTDASSEITVGETFGEIIEEAGSDRGELEEISGADDAETTEGKSRVSSAREIRRERWSRMIDLTLWISSRRSDRRRSIVLLFYDFFPKSIFKFCYML